MKTYASMKELIGDKKANDMGIQYFIVHPSQLIDLMKEDFGLAEKYFAHFSNHHINEITNRARAKNADMYVQHYTFVKQMIEELAYYKTRSIKDMPQLPKATKNEIVPLIWKNFNSTYTYPNREEFPHLYYYGNDYVLYTSEIITEGNAATVKFQYVQGRIHIADALCLYEKTRQHVRNHLPGMIIKFLEQLEPGNTLDFEFVGKRTARNNSFQLLVVNQNYDVIAALLKSISPEIAIQQLQSPVAGKDNKTVLDLLLNRYPLSEHATASVKQAIDAMQALNAKDPDAFKTFIRTPKGYDLLGALKQNAPTLVSPFLDIDSEFLEHHFTETIKGLERPKDPPKYEPPSAPSVDVSSSSAVGAGNSVMSLYNSLRQQLTFTDKPAASNNLRQGT